MKYNDMWLGDFISLMYNFFFSLYKYFLVMFFNQNYSFTSLIRVVTVFFNINVNHWYKTLKLAKKNI